MTIERVAAGVFLAFIILTPSSRVFAQAYNVPPVDLNAKPESGGPFGAFKIVQCDGPEQLAHLDPTTGKIEKIAGQYKYTDPKFVPCNFRGLMMQVQFLINVMIVVGVFAILGMSAWAGALFVSGTPGYREKAKKIFPKLFWGFIIMLTSWFIVYQILIWLTGSSSFLQ